MLNSNKPIESSYLEKLANQSIFNGAFMIEMISTSFCGSMNNFGFLITRESSYQKKTNEDIQLLRCHKMTRIVAPGYSGYHYCTSDAVVYWLSLLHNFIQLSLNSGSAQVQILLAACRRFAMVRISDNGPGWK